MSTAERIWDAGDLSVRHVMSDRQLGGTFLRAQVWADFPGRACGGGNSTPLIVSLLSVIVEPVLTRLKAADDRDAPSLPHALMHADPENCHSIRCARTPHTGGDETTNLSVTPGIPHIRRRLVSKRD